MDQNVFGIPYQQVKNRYVEFQVVAPGSPTTVRAISGYKNLAELNERFYQLAYRVTAAETLDLPPAIETHTRVNLGPRTRKLYD